MGYSGFIVHFDEDRRAELVKEIGEVFGGFSDTFSSIDWGFKNWEVCLLSFDGQTIQHACLAIRGNKAATSKYRVNFSDFVSLNDVPIHDIESRLSENLKKHFLRSASGRGARVPERTWDETILAIKSLRPNCANAIDRLLQLRAQSTGPIVRPWTEQVAQERDAVGVALDVFDSSSTLRQKILRTWVPAQVVPAPYLEGVDAVTLTEEQMLAHDSNVFPEAEIRAGSLGAQFRIQDRILDVIYFNRTAVERALGVDLIYYNHSFKAFTLVQYKRMTEETIDGTNTFLFRPSSDSNFEPELQRIQGFRRTSPDSWVAPKDWDAYRLCGDGFFFKFCPKVTLEVLSPELIRGMYLPREYLESLLQSPVTAGTRGGRLVTFKNSQRHLTNSSFTQLVQDGWIGTRGLSTTEIADIIRASLSAGRSVVAAASR